MSVFMSAICFALTVIRSMSGDQPSEGAMRANVLSAPALNTTSRRSQEPFAIE